jgi:protein O-mannosyl-transferase
MSRSKTLSKAPGKSPRILTAGDAGVLATPASRKAVLCLLLVVITVALYIPVTGYPFLRYDDYDYAAGNPHVQAGLRWSTIAWAFTSTDYSNWHPLTWLSHTLDAQLFGPTPGAHHAINLIIHALNAGLLFLLFTWLTGRIGPSLLVAALFAFHPINVESVAWIAERKNVLSTFFFLAAIGTYGWYAQKADWRRYSIVAALFALGLMSKPMVITLPCVLVLLDYWPLGRMQGSQPSVLGLRQVEISKLLAEKVPLLFLSALSAVITMKAQMGYAVRSMSEFPLLVRAENAIVAYAMYLWKMLWPIRLAPLYPHPGDSLRAWQLVLSALALAGISVLVFMFRSKRYLVTGWLWFLGTLVPAIGLVQVGDAAMADRYAYVPLIGIFVMIAWSLADLADAKRLTTVWRVAPVCVLIALGFSAETQLGYWSNDYDLWSHTLAVTGPNFGAHNNMGTALMELHKPEEAQTHFQTAAEINPRDPVSHLNIGMYLDEHGALLQAVAQLNTAIALTSNPQLLALAYASRGAAYCELGDNAKARESYDRALRLDPSQFNAYMGYAFFLERQGKLNEAISNYSRAVELGHTGQGYARLGHALQLANRPKEALAAYQEALRVSPELAQLLTPVINGVLAASSTQSDP